MNETFNEQDFENLKNGDLKALDKLYVANYDYVLGMLVHRHSTIKQDAEDVYVDAIMKFHKAIQENKIVWGNTRAYLLKIAINLKWERKKRNVSVVKKMETALDLFYEEKQEGNFDKVIAKEEEMQALSLQERKMVALKWAWGELNDVCRELLNDTIINDMKPRFLVEKFSYKNARVVTDKKMKCKEKLLKLVQKRLATP